MSASSSSPQMLQVSTMLVASIVGIGIGMIDLPLNLGFQHVVELPVERIHAEAALAYSTKLFVAGIVNPLGEPVVPAVLEVLLDGVGCEPQCQQAILVVLLDERLDMLLGVTQVVSCDGFDSAL